MIQISQKDRTLAAGVNIAAIFFPYLGPIVGAVIGAKSPYVKFHAYRNLIQQVVATIIIGFLLVCSITYTIYTTYESQKTGIDLSKIDWVTAIVKASVTYLLILLWGFINLILSIRDASQALKGELPIRPKFTDRKAMALAGMNPDPTLGRIVA